MKYLICLSILLITACAPSPLTAPTPTPTPLEVWNFPIRTTVLMLTTCQLMADEDQQLTALGYLGGLNQGLAQWNPPDDMADVKQSLLDNVAKLNQDDVDCNEIGLAGRAIIDQARVAGVTESELSALTDEVQESLTE